MGKTQRIPLRDVMAIMRLQHTLSELVPLSDEWKTCALEKISRLVPQKFVVFSVISGLHPGAQPQIEDAAIGGTLEPDAQAALGEWFQRPDKHEIHPLFNALMENPKRCFTHRRVEVVDDAEWDRSEVLNAYFDVCDVEDNMTTIYRAPESDLAYGFGLHRHPNDSPFTQRDRTVLHLVQRAAVPCYRSFDERVVASRRGLSPRLQETLQCLLSGASEKQVARQLGLSRHTVHDYVKQLHRHFNVSSRAELLIACLDSPDRNGHQRNRKSI